MSDMLTLFEAARRVSVPIVAISTADQAATVQALLVPNSKYPVMQWDTVRGINSVNAAGKAALEKLGPECKGPETAGFVEAMMAAQMLPEKTILFAHNAHRQLQSQEPSATAPAVQAVANLRDTFKLNHRTLVPLAPSFSPPPEMTHDIVVLRHSLPAPEELRDIISELHQGASLPVPKDLIRAVDAVSGLSSFATEQVTAMSLTKQGLDLDALWERKRVTIEQTSGLSVHRGGEMFDDLRGLESVKARLRAHTTAKTPVGVVVWIDEGADVFSNVEHDTSGVTTDQQRTLLVEMEENNWRGMIAVGVPGSGKSAIARAFGNEAGVPTISVDFGAMEHKYVGESEANLRQAVDVIKAVGRGNAFFILTCNSLKGIRPQFQRRFRRGVFFFDLPTKDERDAIWKLYGEKYHVKTHPRPDDDAWTGAEIKECVESAWDVGCTLLESAKYIVPVARSRATEINKMRSEAHGRFLDASKPGAYLFDDKPMAKQVRAITLPAGKETIN